MQSTNQPMLLRSNNENKTKRKKPVNNNYNGNIEHVLIILKKEYNP